MNNAVGIRDRAFERIAWITLLVLLPTIAPLAVGAYRGWVTSKNDIVDWGAEDLATQQAFRTFIERFGRLETIVFSWPGCVLESKTTAALTAHLDSADLRPYFHRIYCADNVLQELSETKFSIDRSQALLRMRGVLVGHDGNSCVVVAVLSERGFCERGKAVAAIHTAAAKSGIDSTELRLAGVGMTAYRLDEETRNSPQRTAPFAGLLMLSLTWLATRSWQVTLTISCLSGYCGLACAALPYWFGIPTNSLLAIQPTLASLLAVSLSLHFVRYVKHASGAKHKSSPVRTAFRLALCPSLAAVTTTAVGIGSLILSETQPIRQFGLFGMLGVWLALALVLLILPGVLSRYPLSERRNPSAWPAYTYEWVSRRRTFVLGATYVVFAFAAWGLPRIQTGVDISNLFPNSHRAITDTKWIEERVEGLIAVEITLRFANPSFDGIVDRMNVVRQVERCVAQQPGVTGTVSACSLLPPLPSEGQSIRAVARRRFAKLQLENQREQFTNSGYLYETNDEEFFRISAMVSTMNWLQHRGIERRLAATVSETLEELPRIAADQVSFDVTGLGEVYEDIQRQLVDDLFMTYATCVGAVFVMVWIGFRRFTMALILMLPNLMPAVIVLGLIAWIGVRLDVGSVITASIALGIAVDDTLHLTMAVTRHVRAGMSRIDSVRESMIQCAPAMVHTTLVCGLGLLTFASAPFLPTSRFGILMCAMLFVALIGDLIVLPALLLSPLSRKCLEPNAKAHSPSCL